MPPSTTSDRPAARNSTIWQQGAGLLALFTSAGTLLCCALPAALAAIAGGAAVVSFISTFPWLVALSHYKEILFIAAGLLIGFTMALVYRPKGTVACRLTGGKGCAAAGRFTKWMCWVSAGIYAVGVFFAYALLPILRLLDG